MGVEVSVSIFLRGVKLCGKKVIFKCVLILFFNTIFRRAWVKRGGMILLKTGRVQHFCTSYFYQV